MSDGEPVLAARSLQPADVTLRRRVVDLLRDTGHLHRQLFRRRIRDIPIAAGEARALLYLGGRQGSTQAQLAEQLDIQPITLTRQIDRLERGGYVVRRSSDEDRRVRLLYLTPGGKALARRLLEIAQALDEEITAELREGALAQLADGLSSMHAVLTRMR